MFDELKKLDLSTKDIELIESALHTQQKILSMQSDAGGSAARRKLSDLKHLIQRVGRARKRSNQSMWSSLTRSVRDLSCNLGRCPERR